MVGNAKMELIHTPVNADGVSREDTVKLILMTADLINVKMVQDV